jgi:RIO kinase 1
MWALYEEAKLTADTELTGIYINDEAEADVDSVMDAINAAYAEEEERKARIRLASEEF